MQWFRWYQQTVSDPKFAGLTRASRQKKVAVLAVWQTILESACETEDGGRYAIPPDEIAAVLELKTEQVMAIVGAMEERGMLEGGVVVAWNKRQFASDSSLPRVRKHRETKRKQESNVTVTLQKQDVTPSETDTEAESEGKPSPSSQKKTPKASSPAAPVRTTTAEQKVIEEAWAFCGLEGKPGGKGYPLARLTVQRHTIPKVRRWMSAMAADPPRPDPDCSGLSVWFGEVLRSEMARAWEWDTGQTRLIPDAPEDPRGTRYPEEIEQYRMLWAPWVNAARNGDQAGRVATWSEAIRKALAGDFETLKAGPPA